MTEYIRFEEFANQVNLAVGDVPIEIVTDYVRSSAIRFCEGSRVLRRDVEIKMWSGVKEYQLPEFKVERAVFVDKVTTVGNQCCPSQSHVLPSSDFKFEFPDRVYLRHPPVCEVGSIEISLALAPKRDACECDSVLYEVYSEGIVQGAVARLLAAVSQPWANAQQAEYFRRLAENSIKIASVDRVVGPQAGPFKLTPRRWV